MKTSLFSTDMLRRRRNGSRQRRDIVRHQ